MKPLKRSVTINGHRTSISLEAEFWEALQEVASCRGMSVAGLIAEIDRQRVSGSELGPENGLSGAVRVYLLNYFRQSHKK